MFLYRYRNINFQWDNPYVPGPGNYEYPLNISFTSAFYEAYVTTTDSYGTSIQSVSGRCIDLSTIGISTTYNSANITFWLALGI